MGSGQVSGLTFRIALCVIGSLLGLTACAAKANLRQAYVTPGSTEVRLKEPCKLDNSGKPKGCKFLMTIKFVVVK